MCNSALERTPYPKTEDTTVVFVGTEVWGVEAGRWCWSLAASGTQSTDMKTCHWILDHLERFGYCSSQEMTRVYTRSWVASSDFTCLVWWPTDSWEVCVSLASSSLKAEEINYHHLLLLPLHLTTCGCRRRDWDWLGPWSTKWPFFNTLVVLKVWVLLCKPFNLKNHSGWILVFFLFL